ncbi:MAG: DUF3147 family protein [Chloroflexi bacterium]|nr:MAG: DUF3147 family protein [Chloroflexota bacterium]TMF78225.1 MAG: DUF3147 family protein [Chloroflexota bacterium]TMF91325.1 MAG: DUF3147 family protein [Chloroflexota bacterium]TMG42761.1 MAG: DUF3147 family protein [Chloroflexota bacterium]
MSAGLIPGIDPGEVGTHRVRDYLIRFCFGAGISLVAGVIGMKFGPVLGGVWLGFPAILPASLTLIEKKEGKEAASVDSIGAILGAIAMIAFAIVVSLAATRWGVVPGLVAALAVWLVVAVGLYGLVATLYGREPSAP